MGRKMASWNLPFMLMLLGSTCITPAIVAALLNLTRFSTTDGLRAQNVSESWHLKCLCLHSAMPSVTTKDKHSTELGHLASRLMSEILQGPFRYQNLWANLWTVVYIE